MAEQPDPELLRDRAEPAAISLRASLNPYFFQIEHALANERWCALGGATAARRYAADRSLRREDYFMEIWAAEPWALGKALLRAMKTPRTNSPKLHMFLAKTGPKLSLGNYTLCTIRRLPQFRGQSMLQLIPPERAQGLFDKSSEVPCLHISTLLYQAYEALAAAEPPKGSSYQELFVHEAELWAVFSASARGAAEPAPARDGGADFVEGCAELTPDVAVGGKQKSSLRPLIAKLQLPIISEYPHMIVLSDNAEASAKTLAAGLPSTLVKRNLLLLPLEVQVAKHTVYEVRGDNRRPVCEIYETPQATPVLVQGAFAAPLSRLQHLFAEIWIASALLASGALSERHASERISRMTELAGVIRKKLIADPVSAIRGGKWYGYVVSDTSLGGKKYREPVFAVDL